MVNIFRRYQQTIMIFVTLVIIVTFVGFYSHSDALDKGGSGRIGVIYGRNVSIAQVQRAARKGDLSQQLGMMELYQSLAVTRREAKDNFVWNSMVLRHEAEHLGVEPTEDEIFEATKAMPIFQTNGVYDSARYSMLTQVLLTPRGFTADDLSDLVADDLRLKKIKAILGSTVAASDGEVRDAFTRLNQKTEATVVRFKLDDFLAAAQVPDADVQKLYEDRKASLKTDELRKVKFVAFVLPTTDKPLAGTERAEALTKLQKQAEDFAVAMTDKNAKFEEVAAKTQSKVEESPEFSIAQPPEVLGGSREIATAAFKLNQQDPNSDVLESDRGYYVLQLAGITPPRPLTFDEAKANLADTLKHERAQEALNLKATDVRNKIEADVKAGKSFAESAQAQMVKAEDFPTFSAKDPKVEPANSGEIMQTASELNVGQISPAVPTPDGSVIVYVAKRLPIDEEQLKKDKGQIAQSIAQYESVALFQQWLKLRRAAAQLSTSFHNS